MIIGISGKIGSGKDTIGQIIQYMTRNHDLGLDVLAAIPPYTDAQLLEVLRGDVTSDWKIKKFADKLKECISIITGISREDLEKIEVKNSILSSDWNYWQAIGDYKSNRENNIEACVKTIKKYGNGFIEKGSITVRQLLQEFGTEACRNNVHPNFWVNALFSDYRYSGKVDSIEATASDGGYYSKQTYNEEFPDWIITDMRFPNELNAIKDRGGITVRVERGIHPNNPSIAQNHISETALDNATFDYTIDNNGSMADLIISVNKILIKEKII
jgi:hypothetical protein